MNPGGLATIGFSSWFSRHVESLESVKGRLVTLRDWVRFGASAFNEKGLVYGHGTDNAVDEALLLALHALHLDHDLDAGFLGAQLTARESARIHALYQRRIDERRPAPYLTHQAWFAGLSFYVDERVLIPRSPIAELIEQRFEPWVQADSVTRILDLCCGSGCIGIACARAFPNSRVDLADVAAGALEVARRNVREHGLEARVAVIRSDLYSGLERRRYDLIVCNPPYVGKKSHTRLPPEYRHEPEAGLVSGPEGLDHPLGVLADAAGHLRPSGVLVLEVGATRSELERRLPRLDATWVEFERGGEGVAVLTRTALESLELRARR